MNIDITMTATIRPKIINKTLNSFANNLLSNDHNYRLIVNIDNIGNLNKNHNNVLNICRKYFKNIVYNTPEHPNFAKAIKWTWSNVDSDIVFHLEDDWIIRRKIDINFLLYLIEKHNDFSSFRLPKRNAVYKKVKRKNNLNKNTLVQCSVVSLNPLFLRKSFLDKVSSVLNIKKNPERQLQKCKKNNKKMCKIIKNTKHCVYSGNGYSLIKDIGITWKNKKENNFCKPRVFLTWKKGK